MPDIPEEDPRYLDGSLVDCCSYTALQLHLKYLRVIRLHGRVQFGHFHLNVLYGHLYWSQNDLLLLSDLKVGRG